MLLHPLHCVQVKRSLDSIQLNFTPRHAASGRHFFILAAVLSNYTFALPSARPALIPPSILQPSASLERLRAAIRSLPVDKNDHDL